MVICGGLSNERDISLLSGRQVYQNLDTKKYNAYLVDVSQTGWKILDQSKAGNFLKEKKRTLSLVTFSGMMKKIAESADVAFLALHGQFGEDGQIQALFDIVGIPYTGSGVLGSSLAMDKYRSTQLAEYVGLDVPKSLLVFKTDLTPTLYTKIEKVLGFPCFVKPNRSGSSVGSGIATNKAILKEKLQDAFSHDSEVIIQERIVGRELTCAVFGNTGLTVTPFPPVEIKTDALFFDRNVKYDSKTIELCPAPLSKTQTKHIQEYASVIHQALGCNGVTRSDFILADSGIFYYLETNTIPGLTETSLAPKEARAYGLSFKEYIDLQIITAQQNHD